MKWNILSNLSLIVFLSLSLLSCSQSPVKTEKPVSTPAVQKEDTLKICLVGDTGTGNENQRAVAKAMLDSKCAYIFIAGDLIYEKGIPYKFLGKTISKKGRKILDERFFDPYKDLLDGGVMFFPIAGNHDHYAKEEAWYEFLHKENKQIYYPARNWQVRINDFCVVAYDPYGSHGEEQVKDAMPDLVEELNPSTCKFSMAMDHYPYFSPGSHGDAKGSRKELMDEFINGKFDLHLVGHDHLLAYSGDKDGTHQVLSGAGGKLREIEKDPRVWAAAVYGYVYMEVTGKKAVLEYRGIDNEVLYKLDISGAGFR